MALVRKLPNTRASAKVPSCESAYRRAKFCNSARSSRVKSPNKYATLPMARKATVCARVQPDIQSTLSTSIPCNPLRRKSTNCACGAQDQHTDTFILPAPRGDRKRSTQALCCSWFPDVSQDLRSYSVSAFQQGSIPLRPAWPVYRPAAHVRSTVRPIR